MTAAGGPVLSLPHGEALAHSISLQARSGRKGGREGGEGRSEPEPTLPTCAQLLNMEGEEEPTAWSAGSSEASFDLQPEPEPEPEEVDSPAAVLRRLKEERAELQGRLAAATEEEEASRRARQELAAERWQLEERLAAVEAEQPPRQRRLDEANARLEAAEQAVAQREQRAASAAEEAAELHVVAEATQQVVGSLLARAEAAEAEAAALAQSVQQLSVEERVADTERRHQDSVAASEQLEAEAAKVRREVGIARYMQTLYWEKATGGRQGGGGGGGGAAGGRGGGEIAVTEQQVDSIRKMLAID